MVVLDFILLSYYDYGYYAASTPPYNTTGTPVSPDVNGIGRPEIIPQNLWYAIGIMLFLAYTLGEILIIILIHFAFQFSDLLLRDF